MVIFNNNVNLVFCLCNDEKENFAISMNKKFLKKIIL